jgi:hypothetical protein
MFPQVLAVPRLEEKLVVSRFKVYFDSQATELRQSLDKVIVIILYY